MADLADAEPAVVEAQWAVSNIKRQHLTEVCAMANPPAAVKMAMESSIIRREDFIANIVNFDTNRQMTRPLREQMKRDYLFQPGFNFEAVNRASKACGPFLYTTTSRQQRRKHHFSLRQDGGEFVESTSFAENGEYNEVLKRKNDSIQEQWLKTIAEDKVVENKITDLLTEWENTRPIQGRIPADVALSTISTFEIKLARVQEEFCRAKEALDLELVKHQ
ncbi:hypothetical protein FRC10_001163 [Ceratobasidium sp. 414]|nr:hypothetical protein FRC10_001163 [Ceratobasidium sp. 414]